MRNSSFKRRVICIAEDREACEPALKLLLLGLNRYNSEIATVVFYPAADQAFINWVRASDFRNISVRTAAIPGAHGWDVKPLAMLQLLNEGDYEVIWIDSDILVTKDVFAAIGNLAESVFVVTEERLGGHNESDALRTRLWGFAIGREFPFPLNSCVMRVTQHHVPLLLRWKELLATEKYQDAQKLPMLERPPHVGSDQDVLTALLASEEFHRLPVKILRRGHHIVQYSGYLGFTLSERLSWIITGMPVFIHEQGWKPWLAGNEKFEGFHGRVRALYQDLSPYIVFAVSVEPRTVYCWMRPRSKIGSILRAIGFGNPALTGLPIALVFDLTRFAKFLRETTKSIVSFLGPAAVNSLGRTTREAIRHDRKDI